MKRLKTLIVKYPGWVIFFVLLVTAFMSVQIKNLKAKPDISDALPSWVPAKKAYDLIEKIFPARDFVLIIVESKNGIFKKDFLKKLKVITSRIESVKGIHSALSITNMKIMYPRKGSIVIREAYEIIDPDSGHFSEKSYRNLIYEKGFLTGNIVSSDEKSTGIVITLRRGFKPSSVVERIKKLMDELAEKLGVEYSMAGRPVINFYLGKGMARDMGMLTLLAIIVAMVWLFFATRSIRGVLIPLVVVILTLLWTFGTMAMTGQPITHSTNIMPVLLFSIGIADSIHLINEYFNELVGGKDNLSAVENMLQHLGMPVIFTSLTTAAGFLALLTSRIESLGQLAIYTSIGVMYALVLTLLVIPSSLIVLGKPGRVTGKKPSAKSRMPVRFFIYLFQKRGVTGFAVTLFIIAALYGFTRIKSEFNTMSNFKKNSPIRKAVETINDKFAGSSTLSIMIRGSDGDMLQPSAMKKIDAFKQYLLSLPHVNEAISYTDMVHSIHSVLCPWKKCGYLPGDKVSIIGRQAGDEVTVDGSILAAQYVELLEMGGQGKMLSSTLDYDRKTALITAFLDSENGSILRSIRKKINRYIKEKLNDFRVLIDGMAQVVLDVNDLIVRGQAISLTVSLFFVMVLDVFLFRSFYYGILCTIPLLFTLVGVFGLMGLSGLKVNLMSMITVNIAVGVGVDYAIHFLYRYRKELDSGNPDAVKTTLISVASPVFFNAMATGTGFAVMLFSSFVNVEIMGFLIAMSMLLACIGALVIFPLLFYKQEVATK